MEQPDPGSIMYRGAGLSRTAEGVAAFRALESMLPEQDRICYDPYAIRFTSPARLASVVAHADTRFPGLRNTIVARVRFFDDTIKEAAQNGLEQLVIMGAGYDTRAYRIDELKENMRVFEIDRPGIQEIKKAKIRDIFGRLPDNVVYVAVDFEIQDFGQRLFECGYSHKKKTLFVMEGLIMYLTLPAIDAMLSFIVKNSGPGSAILFDCSGKTGSHDSMTRKKLEDHTAQSGEPIRFFLPEEGAEAFLVQRGFSQVRTVTCNECRQLYFQGKNNDRNLSRSSSFTYAIVE